MTRSLYILLFLAALLTGCGDSPRVSEEESPAVHMTFSLFVPTGGSRADASHTEVDSSNPAFEDYINTGDFAFFVYAVLPDGSMPFLTKFDSSTAPANDYTGIWEVGGYHWVRIAIPKTEFEQVIPDQENVKLRVVAIVNSYDAYTTFSDGYDTYENLIKSAGNWTFRMSRIYSGTGSTAGNMVAGARIPMFGCKEVLFDRDYLYASDANNPVPGGEINLLRALAKINLVDNLTENPATPGYPHINAVHFLGSNNTAYVLPYGAADYTDGEQVETTRPTDPVQDGTDVVMAHGENSTWAVYAPEQFITDDRPKVSIDILYSETETKKFEVPLSGYRGTNFNFGEAILRNHIYTLEITGEGVEGEITATVVPWKENDPLNLDYTETVTIATDGQLRWHEDSYQNLTGNTVIMKDWAPNTLIGDLLIGEFRIDQPVGAKWTAYLLQTATQDGDAFGFVTDDTMELHSTVSGYVTDDPEEKSQIKIRTRYRKPTGNAANRAELQIVVAIDNGGMTSVIEAPITRYVIVQNP